MMILSYNDEVDEELLETEEEYYDHLEADSWGSNVQGTWKDLD